MRILMTHWVYLPEFSGAALQGHRLACELQKLGVHVQVLTGTHEFGLIGVDDIDGIVVHRKLRDPHSTIGNVRYWHDLTHFIKTNNARIDLVHTHGFHPRVNLAAKRAQLPIITKITNQSVDDPMAVLNRKGGSAKFQIYDFADAVVSTSHVLERLCRTSGLAQEKIIRLPNGVDHELFCPLPFEKRLALREKLHAPQDKIILLTVGTVNYTKGLDALVKAIYRLDDPMKKRIRLWVVGPTTNRDGANSVQAGFTEFVSKVKSMISEFGLQDIVQFKGRQQNVQEFMQAADIYVHPSRKEGQPNAILEAMACGLPVIANLLPGITDEILQTGRYGYLVNVDNPRQFASAIRVLINNHFLRKRVGTQAREHVMKYYSIQQVAQRYVSLYSSIIHKGAFESLRQQVGVKKREKIKSGE